MAITVYTPDPRQAREASLRMLRRLALPQPPPSFPLVWEPGDAVELRPVEDIEARMAVLNVVLARCFGMPPDLAMQWLLDARMVDQLTQPESSFVLTNSGDPKVFHLHIDAIFALTWVLGISMDLDPAKPAASGLVERLPDLRSGESFDAWRSRTLVAPRAPADVATVLDLYYCLDWAYLEAERHRLQLPGAIDSNAIGQRRWALEWVAVFVGPNHEPPGGWEEIDLST